MTTLFDKLPKAKFQVPPTGSTPSAIDITKLNAQQKQFIASVDSLQKTNPALFEKLGKVDVAKLQAGFEKIAASSDTIIAKINNAKKTSKE